MFKIKRKLYLRAKDWSEYFAITRYMDKMGIKYDPIVKVVPQRTNIFRDDVNWIIQYRGNKVDETMIRTFQMGLNNN